MRKSCGLWLVLVVAFCGCRSQDDVRLATQTAAQLDAAFTDHSRKWQEIFMAGNPSQMTITAVMSAAEEDRRQFHSLMNTFIQFLNSFGAVDPVLFQQQALAIAQGIKDLTKK